MNLKNTDKALLALIRQSLFATESTLSFSLEEDEWKQLLAKSDALGVLTLAFRGALSLSPHTLPKYLPDAWSELAFHRAERSERILAEQATLADSARERRIPLLLLAATAAAAYYPDPSLRIVKGTDCLSEATLGELTDTLSLEYPLSVQPCLSVQRQDEMEALRLRSLLARVLDSCANMEIGAHTLPVPSITVEALLLLLEAEEKPSLLLLTDWAVLWQYALSGQDVNLSMQVRSWEQCGLLGTAKTLSLAAAQAFGLEVSEWFADADRNEAESLLKKVLTPSENKLLRAEKNVEIAMKRASRPPKAVARKKDKKETKSDEKSVVTRFFDGLFKK